jgi:hypothetical protein
LGCTGGAILLAKRDEMGMCMMDIMLLNDDYSGLISVIELALSDAKEKKDDA